MSEIKWEPAIKLENPQTTTLSRHDTPTVLVDLPAVKLAYWRRCINGTDPVSRQPYKRFVANKLMLDSYEDRPGAMRIWEPQGPDEDFNLVLSLCTDGMHRLLIDVDEATYEHNPTRLPGSQLYGTSVVPSTSHWHVYDHHGSDLNKQLKMLDGNVPYKENVQRAGFAALRPPWVSKGWAEPSFYRSEFHGFEESDWLPSVPKDDGKTGWEELFGEE